MDNATIESYFSTLKSEFLYLNRFDSIEQLQAGVRQHTRYYNHECIKLELKNLIPVQYRN